MKRVIKLAVLLTLMMVIIGTALHAQSRGGIQGVVKKDGVPVAGVRVEPILYVVSSPLTVEAPAYATVTNSNGEFAIWLPPSDYPSYLFDRLAIRVNMLVCTHNPKATYYSDPMTYTDYGFPYIEFNFVTGLSGTGLVVSCGYCQSILTLLK